MITAERLWLYPRALLVAVFVAIGLSAFTTEATGGRLGGDLPAFYGISRMVLAGDFEHLYDVEAQTAVETDLFVGDTDGGFLPFIYPPYTAVAVAPLSLLPFRAAYFAYTALMIAAVALGVRWFARDLPWLSRDRTAVFAGVFLFHPMFRAATGAQNTAWTFACIVGSHALVQANRPWLAGLALGGTWLKPQFAVPLIGLHLLSGEWRTFLAAMGMGGLAWGVAAAVCGPDWVPTWIAQATAFQALDQHVNSANSVSWLGFTEAVLGAGNPVALVAGWAAALATIAVMAWVWFRGIADRAERLGIAALGTLMISPHGMFYDAGLAVVPLLVLLDREKQRAAWLVAGLWLLSQFHPLNHAIGVTPVFPVCAIAFGWAVWHAVSPPKAPVVAVIPTSGA